MQLAPARHLEAVRFRRLPYPQRHVVRCLPEQAFLDLSPGEVLPFAARKRARVHPECHRQGRLIDGERRHRFRRVDLADGLRHADVVHPGDADDVAGPGRRQFHPLETAAGQHRQHPALAHLPVGAHHRDRRLGEQLAPPDAANPDDAHVTRVVEGADLHLERPAEVGFRRRNMRDDQVEERRHVLGQAVRVEPCDAEGRRREDGREIELRLARSEPVEQVEHLVHHPVRRGAVAVDLVHDQDRRQAGGERFLRHEPGLRHRAFHRVDDEEHRIHHREDPFHLAAKVRVPRRVHDVDPAAVVFHRGRLGEDRDAPLPLQLVAVEGALGDLRARVGRRLLQQAVDERGLAVVHVGHDGDVANLHGSSGFRQRSPDNPARAGHRSGRRVHTGLRWTRAARAAG